MDLKERLASYPGRGLAVRLEPDGWRWIYFVTGRSPASRERSIQRDGDRILVAPLHERPADELRHYACAVPAGDQVVIGNGDHVEVVASRLIDAEIEAAWADVMPEPDPPINTPRIALAFDGDGAPVLLSSRLRGNKVRHNMYRPGRDFITILTTYSGNEIEPGGTAPLSTHNLEPETNLLNLVWDALSAELRVAALSGLGPSLSQVETRST